MIQVPRIFRTLGLVALGLAVAVLVTLLSRRPTGADDPVVEGRPLSYWFRPLAKEGIYWDSSGEPMAFRPDRQRDATREYEAFLVMRAAGTNAVPFLLHELVGEHEPAGLRGLADAAWQWLPARFRNGRSSAEIRASTAESLLKSLRPPGRLLVDLVAPAVASSNTPARARGQAVALLGVAGSDPEPAADFARDVLRSGDLTIAAAAQYALMELGPAASNAVPELRAGLIARTGQPLWTIYALGNLGPSAESAIPELESLFRDGSTEESIAAALALVRIRPGHPEALARLRAIASGAMTQSDGRIIRTSQFLGHFERIHADMPGAGLSALLETVFRRQSKRWSTDGHQALAQLNRLNPAAAEALVRELIATPQHETDATYAAARLLHLQPTNTFAKEKLIEAARAGGMDRFMAASGLLHAAELTPAEQAVIRDVCTAEGLPKDLRSWGAYQLERMQLRERFPAPPR